MNKSVLGSSAIKYSSPSLFISISLILPILFSKIIFSCPKPLPTRGRIDKYRNFKETGRTYAYGETVNLVVSDFLKAYGS